MHDFIRGYVAYLEIFVKNHLYAQFCFILLLFVFMCCMASNSVEIRCRIDDEKHERLKQEIIAELKGGDSSD